jgi:hypothetical protein
MLQLAVAEACSPCTRGPCSRTTPARPRSACRKNSQACEGRLLLWHACQAGCDMPGRFVLDSNRACVHSQHRVVVSHWQRSWATHLMLAGSFFSKVLRASSCSRERFQSCKYDMRHHEVCWVHNTGLQLHQCRHANTGQHNPSTILPRASPRVDTCLHS